MKHYLPAMKCPHCRTLGRIRSSKELSPLLREIYYQCDDLDCGHTWVASLEAIRTLSPSAKPNPAITKELPSSQWIPERIRTPLPAAECDGHEQIPLIDESGPR